MDFLTASQDLTLTARKSDFENVSKSTKSLNSGSISTLEKSMTSSFLGCLPAASFRLRLVLLRHVQRLHCGEQDDVADGVCAGEEHDGAVDAHAHAACGGHAVFERGEEILVEHFGLVVAAFALLDLLHEAFALVDRVVQLGIGVAHLAAADEELEPLGQARVDWAALGQRARPRPGTS